MTEFAGSARAGFPRRTLVVTWVALPIAASVVMVAVVAAVLSGAPASTRNVAVPVFVVGAGVLFGLGLSDISRARDVRFARALILAGLVWSLSALSASSEPALYSLGRASQWFVELAIVYVLLVFPSGRLLERTDRWLFAGGALIVVVLYLPTALVAQFPHPSLWTNCTSSCPHNAFAVGRTTPAPVTDFVVPMRETLTVAVLAAVAVAVTRRWRSAGPLLRQFYAPIAWIAVLQVLVFVLYFPIRRAAPGSWVLPVLSWADVLSLPAVALACLAGRLYRRLFAAATLHRIARDLKSSATAAQVRRAMADALGDPSLRILHSFPGEFGGWIDETGSPVALPPDAANEITEVASGSWRIAIVHDPALAEDRTLMRTAGSYALAALENDRLTGELRSSLEQLAESQARGIVAEDRERQKIERDLHDGAQQRLVAMRVKLGLAAAQFELQNPAGAEVIRALGHDIDATIDEVRGFARGIYPPLLVQTGLREALRAIGRVAALPTTVRAEQLDRYPPEVETSVYFSCSEALQNAAKHARGATQVAISVWQDRQLHFEIRDDGAGFDVQNTPFGTGLSSLRDRLAAVNGAITIRSVPGHGTTITGTIPIPVR